jgi:hypothetical protein
VKRQFRDPHGDWWDKQERRNFGEPVHEDHDTLGMFTPYEYTWVSPGKGAAQVGAFILTFLGVCWIIRQVYPDKPSYPREFEGGLERELGGKGATRVSLEQMNTRDARLTAHNRQDLLMTRSRSKQRSRNREGKKKGLVHILDRLDLRRHINTFHRDDD